MKIELEQKKVKPQNAANNVKIRDRKATGEEEGFLRRSRPLSKKDI